MTSPFNFWSVGESPVRLYLDLSVLIVVFSSNSKAVAINGHGNSFFSYQISCLHLLRSDDLDL